MVTKKGRTAKKRNTVRVKRMSIKRSNGIKRSNSIKRSNGIKRRHPRMKGGSSISPFVGAPYSSSGLNFPPANYYPRNMAGYPIPSASNTFNNKFVGGGSSSSKRKTKKIRRQQKGGNFFTKMMPNDLVNAVRAVPASFNRFISGWDGRNTLASDYVSPTAQPLAKGERVFGMAMPPPNIMEVYRDADAKVSNI